MVAGAGKLADGVGQLNSKTPELAGGVNKLVTGVNQLTEKSGQLVTGADKLARRLQIKSQWIQQISRWPNIDKWFG